MFAWGLDFWQPIMMMRPAVAVPGTWHPCAARLQSKSREHPGTPRRALSGTQNSWHFCTTVIALGEIRLNATSAGWSGRNRGLLFPEMPDRGLRAEPARRAQAMTFKWATRADKQAALDTQTARKTVWNIHAHTYMISYETYSWRIPWPTCCNAVAIFSFRNTVDQISIGLHRGRASCAGCTGCSAVGRLGGCFLWAALRAGVHRSFNINAWHSLAVVVLLSLCAAIFGVVMSSTC